MYVNAGYCLKVSPSLLDATHLGATHTSTARRALSPSSWPLGQGVCVSTLNQNTQPSHTIKCGRNWLQKDLKTAAFLLLPPGDLQDAQASPDALWAARVTVLPACTLDHCGPGFPALPRVSSQLALPSRHSPGHPSMLRALAQA